MLKICVISLFPEMFDALNCGIPSRAQEANLLDISYMNPRDFADNKYRNVDDRPYGGGPGMVMMYQPLADAIDEAKNRLGQNSKVIYLSPQGTPLKQTIVEHLAEHHRLNDENLILLCGRYEGIDERLIEDKIDQEISIGDYILSGGEFAAMVLIDALTRLLPGALGAPESAQYDSFSQAGLLDHPHYTRPEIINGKAVPDVLLSGDHKKIKQWRAEKALEATKKKRPDLPS